MSIIDKVTESMTEKLPKLNYKYPECYSEYSLEKKQQLAEEIYEELGQTYLPRYVADVCQRDFKICSLVAYKRAVDVYSDEEHISQDALHPEMEIFERAYHPVAYSGGDMVFGRLFSINHCAFSSSDSIIGFRNSEANHPQEYFKILKGLKYVGTRENWVLFKLDKDSTDDMTGMLYTPLEKNFTIEFAHFPHNGSPRCVYRLLDC